jgi:hypothetical protein
VPNASPERLATMQTRSLLLEALARKLQRSTIFSNSADDILGRATRNICPDFQRNPDGRAHQSSEMGDDLVGDGMSKRKLSLRPLAGLA